MTEAPAAAPTINAICCRLGDAPPSWPVLRSCRLSFEIVAQAKTIAVTKRAKATSAGRFSAVGCTTITSVDAQMTIERMPTPEIGLFDAPISPAMYPQTPAIRNPTSSTKGTENTATDSALDDRLVERA